MQIHLNLEDLENVTGGSDSQTKELKAFIRKHDPDYEVDDDIDVMRWLYKYSGLSWSSISITPAVPNQYVLSNGKHLSQDELLAKLSERYPD